MISDKNVNQVLKDDGVDNSLLEPGHKYENVSTINIKQIEEERRTKIFNTLEEKYGTSFREHENDAATAIQWRHERSNDERHAGKEGDWQTAQCL